MFVHGSSNYISFSCQGVLEALRGRTDAARRMIASARKMVEELGIAGRLFETDVFAGFVAMRLMVLNRPVPKKTAPENPGALVEVTTAARSAGEGRRGSGAPRHHSRAEVVGLPYPLPLRPPS